MKTSTTQAFIIASRSEPMKNRFRPYPAPGDEPINMKIIAAPLISIFLCLGLGTPANAESKVDVKDKVVLANIDKHEASFRINGIKRDIKSRKASVLTPKQYPLSIDVWNGKRGQGAWIPKRIEKAGVYTFRFNNGEWQFSKYEPKTAAPSKPGSPADSKAKSDPKSQGTANTGKSSRTSRQPTYRRSVGSPSRVVRGTGRYYYGGRVPFLRRVCVDFLWLYRFVRDEEDRDLIREIIIGGEIDDAIEEELWDRLDDLAVNLPASDRLDFERALDDLRALDEQDLRDLENATDEEWGQVRDGFGDLVDDNSWKEIESDFGEIETGDLAAQDLGLTDLDTLESDVDLGDLAADVAEPGLESGLNDLSLGGDAENAIGNPFEQAFGGSLDDVDIGDLSGGIEDIDVGDLGDNFAGNVGDLGVNASDGIADGGLGDLENNGFTGNLGFGGGGNPLGDLGMNYDAGGFDNYQGGVNGNLGESIGGGAMGGAGDFGEYQGPEFGGMGGADFGGGNFGGGLGGDFGGGLGGDFGGGFGGGFDDFGGGGFDDFGGDFGDF